MATGSKSGEESHHPILVLNGALAGGIPSLQQLLQTVPHKSGAAILIAADNGSPHGVHLHVEPTDEARGLSQAPRAVREEPDAANEELHRANEELHSSTRSTA